MANASKLALIKEMLDTAETSLRSAKQMLVELIGSNGGAKNAYIKMAENLDETDEKNVVEGVFDGQNMIGKDKRTYPVPANYASKSKLVAGDVLKLTIQPDGSFVYKQIGPVERKRLLGTITYEDGQYKIIASGKAYKVLLASVTYFKAEIGDKVTLIIPEVEETEWGSIENVLPKNISEGDALELFEK